MVWWQRIAPVGAALSTCPLMSRRVWCGDTDGKASGKPPQPAFQPLSSYNQIVKSFDSRTAAYRDLGANLRIKSHCARVFKSRPNHSLLFCHLHPSCKWTSALVRVGERWELRSATDADSSQHNANCAELRGKRGLDTLEQRKALEEKFTGSAIPLRPREALRSMSGIVGPDSEVGVDLPAVQRLKKTICGGDAKTKVDLGELTQAVLGHTQVPAAKHKGFFAVKDIRRSPGGAPHVILVATTPHLLSRWTLSRVACIDGGWKYNVMGYPLHLFGVLNEQGNMAVTGLGVTSTVSKPFVAEMLRAYARQVSAVNERNSSKDFLMSDAEGAYREGMKEAFGGENLMCWFHVVSAVRDWLGKHAKLDGKHKHELWIKVVKPDLDSIHFSMSPAEFASKISAVLGNWKDSGVDAATAWVDKKGKHHCLSSYFQDEWVVKQPEWYFGHRRILPTTNNASESNIKMCREDAGSIPNAMGDFINFLRAQAEFYSKQSWDHLVAVAPSKGEWARALEFRPLFGTRQIHEHKHGHLVYHICSQRSNPSSNNVAEREAVPASDAKRAFSIFMRLQRQEPITYDELSFYSSMRLFWHENGQDHCTCRAFPAELHCFHILALALRSGRRLVPMECDPTPLSAARSGKRARAGDRYSKEDSEQTITERLAELKLLADKGISEQGPSRKRPSTATADESPIRKRPATASAAEGAAKPAKFGEAGLAKDDFVDPAGDSAMSRHRIRGKHPKSAPQFPSCFVCGSRDHPVESCPLVPAGWWSDALPEDTLREAIFPAEMSWPKSRSHVGACPADGDCLFTAIGTEAIRLKPSLASEVNTGDVGPSLRALFLVSLARADAASESVENVPVRVLMESSSGQSWNEYLRMMQRPSGAIRSSWGGFAEIIFLANFLNLRIEVYEFHLETIRRIMATGQLELPVARIVWSGSHFNPVTLA